MTWERFGQLLDKMMPYSAASDWAGLERYYQSLARQLSASSPPPQDLPLPGFEDLEHEILLQSPWAKAEREVTAVDLSHYTAALTDLLRHGYERAQQLSAKAIYFEYDIDNDWKGWLFLYDDYYPEAVGHDDWACKWIEDIRGPKLPVFTHLYNSYGGFDVYNDTEISTTLYLIARTVVCFGRSVSALPQNGFAVCIGYHDQGKLTRIRKPR